MKSAFWQNGKSLDYTNAGESKIPANTVVVIGDRIGVAGTDIAVGETGSLLVEGVFEMTKSSENAITIGKTVYFDGTGITEAANDGAQTPTAYPKAGYAASSAAAADSKILVKID